MNTPERVLTLRELTGATLARQMLLERKNTSASAVGRLAGLQAQVASPPYVGLWTRLEGFGARNSRGSCRNDLSSGRRSCARPYS